MTGVDEQMGVPVEPRQWAPMEALAGVTNERITQLRELWFNSRRAVAFFTQNELDELFAAVEERNERILDLEAARERLATALEKTQDSTVLLFEEVKQRDQQIVELKAQQPVLANLKTIAGHINISATMFDDLRMAHGEAPVSVPKTIKEWLESMPSTRKGPSWRNAVVRQIAYLMDRDPVETV